MSFFLTSLATSIFGTDNAECGTYIALSTIPGAGLGMFAGKSVEPGEEVTSGDIVVPLVDLPFHSDGAGILWDEYDWGPESFPHMVYDGDDLSGASPGVGAIPNCFFPLLNIKETSTVCDGAGLSRAGDPGAGSFTPYHNRCSKATRSIAPGEEIFVNYGQDYFETRIKSLGRIPLPLHYSIVNRLLKVFDQSIRHHDSLLEYDRTETDGSRIADHVYKLTYEILSLSEDNLHWITPDSMEKLDAVLETGVEWLYHERSIRPVPWLAENGVCSDNIVPGRSHIRQAGRGAFAKRLLREGGAVAPLPLIHVRDRDHLVVYESQMVEEGEVADFSRPVHYQLLLNYCMGHRDSSLLLCPYGVGTSLINHSRKKANVRLEWSKKLTQHPEWFDLPPSKWDTTSTAGLGMEVIAIRDIQPGEEIYMDYGEEWEEAWTNHSDRWKPPPDGSTYVDALYLNAEPDSILSTDGEDWQDLNTSVTTYCRDFYLMKAGLPIHHGGDDTESKHQCRIIARERKGRDFFYSVEVVDIKETTSRGSFEKQSVVDVKFIAFDLPRDAFVFIPSSYSKDYQQLWAFRHDIRVPDRLFPDVWKVKKQKSPRANTEGDHDEL